MIELGFNSYINYMSECCRNKAALIVDDEDGIRETMSFILERRFGRVFTAVDGNSALNILNKEKIDFVITDINMPGMDGREFVKRVRSDIKDLPVIFIMSGNDLLLNELKKEDIVSQALEKPIQVNNLFALIDSKFSQKP